MTIKLCDWERHYPDGCTMTAYMRIQRLLQDRGMDTEITITEWTEAGLRRALDKLEGR